MLEVYPLRLPFPPSQRLNRTHTGDAVTPGTLAWRLDDEGGGVGHVAGTAADH